MPEVEGFSCRHAITSTPVRVISLVVQRSELPWLMSPPLLVIAFSVHEVNDKERKVGNVEQTSLYSLGNNRVSVQDSIFEIEPDRGQQARSLTLAGVKVYTKHVLASETAEGERPQITLASCARSLR